MKPKKINSFHAVVSDIEKTEVGEFYPYDNLPKKIGDLVVLEIYPDLEDVREYFEYTDKYPPEYWILAEVVRFTDSGGFYCKVLENHSYTETARKEK